MHRPISIVFPSLSALCLALLGVFAIFSWTGSAVNAQTSLAKTPTQIFASESPVVLSPSPTQEAYVSNLPILGTAPEIQSLSWLNSEKPLRLAHLRGSVVLLEFWTFDCINCIRTLPYIEAWYEDYHDQGLEVVGIHYPEFSYERDLQNVLATTQRLNVTYPVGQDNDQATWRAYGQHYWPTVYLIDKRGNIRYKRIGEGAYDETEAAINDLLAETSISSAEPTATPAEPLTFLTPDTILNVRSGPSIDQAQIGAINPGMAFVILGEVEGWYEIRYNDGSGYVSGEYVMVMTQ